MPEFFPLLIVGGLVGLFAVVFSVAWLTVKDKKQAAGFDRNMPDKEIIRRLAVYAKPYWKRFVFALLLMVFSIVYDIAAPLIVGNIEEMITMNFEVRELGRPIALYASLMLVSIACTYLQAVELQKTGQKIISSLRMDLFEHLQSLSHAQLNAVPTGTLVTRICNDTNAVSRLFTNILVSFIKNIFIILGVLIAMLCVNYALTLMVLCFAPFILLFTLIFRKFSRRAYRQVKDATTSINAFLSENLSGMKIIQIFNREKAKNGEFSIRNEQLGRTKRKEILVYGVFRPVVYMLYISSVLCLLYLGGRGAIKSTPFLGQVITGGTVVTFYMYISKFFDPIQNLAEQFNWLQSAFASAEKIFSMMDIVPELQDAPDAIELPEVRGEVEFRNVWFSYIPGEWVLQDVSFKVEAGQTVALVGATGSGKSTILSLLCRNYEIQQGEILVDGIDIRKIKISSLRRHFGQMLQDVFLFSGTIRSNLLLRSEGIDDEEVMEACRYVNADSFISRLPNGLDEEVRERGNNFSAGQRQLLSFARTILHKPEIMILDEATANIDTETEILIQNSLEKLMNIGTMIMVAHRLSTIRNADTILVLSHGKIVERGTHEQLLENHGKYWRLYTLQQERQRLTE